MFLFHNNFFSFSFPFTRDNVVCVVWTFLRKANNFVVPFF